MVDSLAINVTIPGADSVRAALQSLQAETQKTAAAINALGGNLGQATQQHAAHTEAVGRTMGAYLSLGTVVNDLPGPLGNLGHAFAAIHTQLTDVQAVTLGLGAAIGGLGVAITDGLAGAVQQTMAFQEQMGAMRAILPVADVDQFGDALTRLAQKLGQETVFSSTQAIEAMGNLARAGLSTSDILDGVAKATLDMAAAMGSDPKNAALALGAAIREFNLTAADAPKVADLFSQAVHVAGLSADGLRLALGNAGPIIRAMGGDLQDAVTGIETLARSGISAGKAGTQLAQLYQDVVNPRTKEAADLMRQLGFITEDGANKFVDATGKVRPFVEVARILSEGLSQLTPQQEALATQTEFTRRAMLGAMVVANQYATGGLAQLTEAQNNARTAAQAMQERLDNLWGSAKQLSSSIQTLAVDIGSSLAPALRPAVDGLKDMVNGLISLGPQAHTTIAAVAGVEAAVLTLSGAALSLSVALPLVSSALAAVGISVTAVLGPIGLLAAATGLLAAAWVNDWGGVQETVKGAVDEIKADLDILGGYLSTIVVPQVQSGLTLLSTTFTTGMQDVATAALDAWNAELPPDAFMATISRQFVGTGFGQIAGVVQTAATEISTNWTDTIKAGILSGLGFGLPVAIYEAFNLAKPAMQDAVLQATQSIQIFDAEAHRADLLAQGVLSADAVAQGMQTELETALPEVVTTSLSSLDAIWQQLSTSGTSLAKALQQVGTAADAAPLLEYGAAMKTIDQAISTLTDKSIAAEIIALRNTGQETAALELASAHLTAQQNSQAESHQKVAAALDPVQQRLTQMWQSITAGLPLWKQLELAAASAGQTMQEKVAAAFAAAGRSTDDFLGALYGRAKDAESAGKAVGEALVNGVQAGMDQYQGAAVDKFKNLMGAVITGGRDAIGAHSPSTLAAEQIGAPLAEGIGEGFVSAMPSVQSQIDGAMSGLVASVGDYARKASAAFDSNLVFSGGGEGLSGGAPGSFAANTAYQTLASRFSQYLPFSSFGMGPEGRAVDVQQQANAFLDAQKAYWQEQYGTSDPAKAQAAYLQSLGLQGYDVSALMPGGSGAGSGPSTSATAIASSGGASSPGGNLTGTSGTGFATSPISFYDAKTGVLPSGGRTLDYGDMARNAADFSKALASLGATVPIVSLSWSSIRDWSAQAANSIAGIPQAFSAYALTPTPGLGNPAANTGGSGAFLPSGNTYGGQAFGALQNLAAQVLAAHPDASPDAQARLIQDGMRTNQDYIRQVGTLTDTTDDLRRQQEDATNQVNNWTNVVNMGIPAAQELADAQAHLTAVTNQLAATATAPTVPASTPWVGTPGGPPPTKPPEGAPPGHWVVGPYGQGWQWLPDSSATTPPKPTTGGLPMAAGGIVTAPTRALLGEAGPEAVIPLGRGMGGGPVTINLTYNAGGGSAGNATDMAAFVRKFREEARRQGVDMSRLGGL